MIIPRYQPSMNAARVISRAFLDAEQWGSNSIYAEHLLLALMSEDGGIAATVLLEDLKVDPQRAKRVVDQICKPYYQPCEPKKKPEVSQSMDKVLSLATHEAERVGLHLMEPEHILLGLAGANDRMLNKVFDALDLKPEKIRPKVHERIPETPLLLNGLDNVKFRFIEELYNNFTYYIPQPIRRLFGRWIDASKMPPLG